MKNLKTTIKTSAISLAILASANASADIQHLDDVIISFSLCVGNDCVNGESFGFDTLRLKENNTRFHFDDTSSSASFPRNDWRIVANDSSNGGGSYLAIEDSTAGRQTFRVDAGAPANALRVDAQGDIGIGTASPVVNLHVVEGNTPTLRLEQDGTSGFSAQTWDVAGNETNFFVRDASNGSTLPFRIFPGASSNALTIAADDNIAFGTTSSPTHASHNTKVNIQGESGSHNSIVFNSSGSNKVSSLIYSKQDVPQWYMSSRNEADSAGRDFDRLAFYDNSIGETFTLFQGGKIGFGVSTVDAANDIEHSNGAFLTTGGVWTNNSSRAHKNDIVDISNDVALKALSALNPVTYSYKSQPDETYAGFIAEDVPEIVATNDRKGLAAMDIVAVLTKVVKEQNKTIQSLNERLTQIERSSSK